MAGVASALTVGGDEEVESAASVAETEYGDSVLVASIGEGATSGAYAVVAYTGVLYAYVVAA